MFGSTSGYRCSSVLYSYYSKDGHYGMVVMHGKDGTFCRDGDSGGPYFYGGTAYGIHMGWVDVGPTLNCWYTPVRRFYSTRNYKVYTR